MNGAYSNASIKPFQRNNSSRITPKKLLNLEIKCKLFLSDVIGQRSEIPTNDIIHNEFMDFIAYMISPEKCYLRTVKMTQAQMKRYNKFIYEKKSTSGIVYKVISFTLVKGGEYVINYVP
jgi:hypothetical protein